MDRLIAVIEFLRFVMDRYHVPRLGTVQGALGLRGTRVQRIGDLSSTAKRDRVRLKEETRAGFPFFVGERRCSKARTAPVKVHVAGVRAGPVCIELDEVRSFRGYSRHASPLSLLCRSMALRNCYSYLFHRTSSMGL